MDSPELQQMWEELAALRARVEQVEARLARSGQPALEPAPGLPAPAVRQAGEPAAAPVSFTQPARPSLESRIGSQWLNRVGIVAVLVGVAWALKYAADRAWIGPAARVGLGLLSGIGLIGWSERFRQRRFPVFSYSLKAVGTGILYLSLWASFSIFHLLSYPAAFAGMVVVTAATAWVSWRQRSELLAAYAATGGFLTPVLLAQDRTAIWTLGSYLLLLNAGLFALLVLRDWPRLLLAAFTGSAAYLVEMAIEAPQLQSVGEQGAALTLALLGFVGFSLASTLLARRHDAREDRLPAWLLVGVAVANALLGAGELWRLTPSGWPGHWLGALLAVWFGALLLAQARQSAGTLLAPWHAGFCFGFAGLGILTALSGEGVVTGWTLEAATLLVLTLQPSVQERRLAPNTPIPAALLLCAASAWLVALSLGHLSHSATVLFNQRAALYLLVIAVAVLAVRIAARQHGLHREGNSPRSWTSMGTGSALLATIMLLLAGIFEIHSYWAGAAGTAERFWISAWAALLGVGLLVLGFALRWAFLRWQALGLLTLAVAKVFAFDTSQLSQGFRILSFLGLGVLLMAVSFIYQRDLLRLRGREHD